MEKVVEGLNNGHLVNVVDNSVQDAGTLEGRRQSGSNHESLPLLEEEDDDGGVVLAQIGGR